VGFYEKRAQRAAARAIDAMPHPRWDTAALTGKAETGVGVTASATHDFNRHAGVVKPEKSHVEQLLFKALGK
jgi:hypothetical protein